jgi:hypothetical protein
MPELLAEDRALKVKLSGIKVTDTNAPAGGRPVTVKYGMPETERSDLTFPMIFIEHTDITPDPEREHRGRIDLGYSPEGFDPVTIVNGRADYRSGIYSEFPIPYNLDYQVTVISRNSQHDIFLAATMLHSQYLPARFGFLEIPEDGTTRSLFLLGSIPSNDFRDQDGKRLFGRLHSIRIATEIVENAHTISAVESVISEINNVE